MTLLLCLIFFPLLLSRSVAISKGLHDSSMEERNSALFEINEKIKSYPMTDEIREQILRLAEDDRMNKEYAAKGELGEQYHSQLITALGNTRDSRAVPF